MTQSDDEECVKLWLFHPTSCSAIHEKRNIKVKFEEKKKKKFTTSLPPKKAPKEIRRREKEEEN